MTILGKKKVDGSTATLANLIIAVEKLEAVVKEQVRQTSLLFEILKAAEKQANNYTEFINVIQNFFAIQKKLSIEEAKAKAAREAEFDLTEADKKY